MIDINNHAHRPWQIYQDLAMVLIEQAQHLYGKDEITESFKILDSSTIDLCLSLFPWAEFRQQKAAAIKLHTMMQVLSVVILERMTLKQLFSDKTLTQLETHNRNHLELFD